MTTGLKELLRKKSDTELMVYLNDFNRFTPEAITEAVDELKRRGKSFTDEELNEISLKIKRRTEAEKDEADDGVWASNSWKKNVVADENAPLFYSPVAIRGFSIFFSVIFGAVLLASNIDDKKKKWIVIGFGLIYTTITIILVNLMPVNTYLVWILNTAGGLGLTTTFWDKYIGKATKYRTKPIWKPLIISILISIPFVLALIYS